MALKLNYQSPKPELVLPCSPSLLLCHKFYIAGMSPFWCYKGRKVVLALENGLGYVNSRGHRLQLILSSSVSRNICPALILLVILSLLLVVIF